MSEYSIFSNLKYYMQFTLKSETFFIDKK